ncbi:hypothetical protein KJ972_03135, partial [Candidatus Micrarchaeota archaeon]|nr:hypothetical protein [Candidatus Micrarchaeota archaeon]
MRQRVFKPVSLAERQKKQALIQKRLLKMQNQARQNQRLKLRRAVRAENHQPPRIESSFSNAQPNRINEKQKPVRQPAHPPNPVNTTSQPHLRLVRPPATTRKVPKKTRSNQEQRSQNAPHPAKKPKPFVPRLVYPPNRAAVPRARTSTPQEPRRTQIERTIQKPTLRLVQSPKPKNQRRYKNVSASKPKPILPNRHEARARQRELRIVTVPDQTLPRKNKQPTTNKPRLRLVKPAQPTAKTGNWKPRRTRAPVAPIQRMISNVSRTQKTVRRQLTRNKVRMVSIQRAQQAQERLKKYFQQPPHQPIHQRMVVGMPKPTSTIPTQQIRKPSIPTRFIEPMAIAKKPQQPTEKPKRKGFLESVFGKKKKTKTIQATTSPETIKLLKRHGINPIHSAYAALARLTPAQVKENISTLRTLQRYNFYYANYKPFQQAVFLAEPKTLIEIAKATGTNASYTLRYSLPATINALGNRMTTEKLREITEIAKATGTNASDTLEYSLPATINALGNRMTTEKLREA